MNPKEINEKYPIRNPVWSFDLITGRWIAEASEIQVVGLSDPWKRMFPPGNPRRLMDSTGEEVHGWVYPSSVAGTPIECVIFND